MDSRRKINASTRDGRTSSARTPTCTALHPDILLLRAAVAVRFLGCDFLDAPLCSLLELGIGTEGANVLRCGRGKKHDDWEDSWIEVILSQSVAPEDSGDDERLWLAGALSAMLLLTRI